MKKTQIDLHLGKKGLTKEFIEDIKKRVGEQPNINIKISVLASARKSKGDVKKYAEELIKGLGEKFTYRVLGFSIFLKKWRKAREIKA